MNEFIINVSPLETRIALLENKRLVELTVEREEQRSLVGNIYKGRVDSIVPGIQAAFIDIGLERNGFLYVGTSPAPRVRATSNSKITSALNRHGPVAGGVRASRRYSIRDNRSWSRCKKTPSGPKECD